MGGCMEAINQNKSPKDELIPRPLRWSMGGILAFLAFLTALMAGVLHVVVW